MLKRIVAVTAVATLAACQTMGGLTVKDYTAKSGQRVMAGQAEPKADYACQKLAQEKEAWGVSGNMNTVAAMERVTAAAVEKAPGRGGNYAYIVAPAQIGVGAMNVNAFSDAQVVYYKCSSLPAAK